MPEGENGATQAGLDPAALTPNRTSMFGMEVKSRLADWQAADLDDPVEPDAGAEKVAEEAPETEPEAELEETSGDEATPEETEAKAALDSPTPEEAAERGETDEAASQPKKEKPYAAKVAGADFEIPDDLVLRYRADGQERERPLDEVIRFAQLGENYDRRSRELAQRQRDQEAQYQERLQTLGRQFQEQQAQLAETLRRFAEDEEYREQFLLEWQQLTQNPELLQLHLKAARADELEREQQARAQRELEMWNRQVWRTVDALLAEGIGTDEAPGPYRYANAESVRRRFHEAYQQRGQQVLSDAFLRRLMEEEHNAVASVVEAEKRRALELARSEVERAVAEARAAAVVETRNQITDKALERAKTARRVVTKGNAPQPGKKTGEVKTFSDAKKKLASWVNE